MSNTNELTRNEVRKAITAARDNELKKHGLSKKYSAITELFNNFSDNKNHLLVNEQLNNIKAQKDEVVINANEPLIFNERRQNFTQKLNNAIIANKSDEKKQEQFKKIRDKFVGSIKSSQILQKAQEEFNNIENPQKTGPKLNLKNPFSKFRKRSSEPQSQTTDSNVEPLQDLPILTEPLQDLPTLSERTTDFDITEGRTTDFDITEERTTDFGITEGRATNFGITKGRATDFDITERRRNQFDISERRRNQFDISERRVANLTSIPEFKGERKCPSLLDQIFSKNKNLNKSIKLIPEWFRKEKMDMSPQQQHNLDYLTQNYLLIDKPNHYFYATLFWLIFLGITLYLFRYTNELLDVYEIKKGTTSLSVIITAGIVFMLLMVFQFFKIHTNARFNFLMLTLLLTLMFISLAVAIFESSNAKFMIENDSSKKNYKSLIDTINIYYIFQSILFTQLTIWLLLTMYNVKNEYEKI